MRHKNVAFLVIAVVVVSTWFVGFQFSRNARGDRAVLADQSTQLEAAIQRAKERAEAAEKNLGDLQHTSPRAGPTARATAASQNKAASAPLPTSQRELISSDPKLEVLSLRWQRLVVGLEYGPFFRAQGLSPEQVRKFEENYAAHSELAMDVAAVAQTKNESGKETATALQQKAQAAYEAAQIGALGAEGFRSAQEYIRTLAPRNVVVLGLAGAAAYEGIPLSSKQGDDLWQAAIKAGGANANTKGGELVAAIDWDAFNVEARRILTPAQFELYKNVAPPAGFGSPSNLRSNAMLRRAQETEAATGAASPPAR